VAKKTVSAALACAFALLAPGMPAVIAAPDPAPAATAAPVPVQMAALRAEIKALKARRTEPGADVPAIDARLAKLETRLAQLDAARAAGAPGSSTGPVVEGGSVASKTTIGRDELQSQNAQNTYDAVKNVPGVAQADAKAGGGADNLQIRGIHLASATGYRLDGGLSMVNNVMMATEDKERVQVLKGAGALEYGIASPAGIINYVLKRATNRPINEVSFSGNGFGQATSAIDIGRKFGVRKQFGVRLNLTGGETGGYVQGAGGTRWLGAMTADWTTDRARVRLGFEKFGMNIVENASLLQNKPGANGLITLPKIPDPTKLLSGDWDRSVGGGQNVEMRADVRANDAATVTFELGRSDAGRDHRTVTQIGTYNVVTGKGTETATFVRDQRYINTYANLSTTIKADHGDFFSNALTLGYTRNERLGNNPVTTSATFKQNIYDPSVLPAPAMPSGPIAYAPQNSRDYDYYFSDAFVLARHFHLTGGLREINYTSETTTNNLTAHSSTSFLAPAVGAIIDLNRHFSLYGSYVKSLEESASAPINAKNAFAILPPAPATQKELGIRALGPSGFSASLAYFSIDRANATIDPITNIFGLNGTNLFSGYESTLNLRLAPRLTLVAGGQYMDAKQKSIDDPTINGKIPENSPRLSGNVGLNYAPRFLPGLQLNGSIQGVGPREINPQDQGLLPAVTLTNFGAAYTRTIGDRQVTFNVNCRNCSDKRYWSSAVNGALGIGPPRTISFSVRFAGLR